MKIFLFILALLTLTACTNLQAPTPSSTNNNLHLGNHYLTWPERENQLKKITHWTLNGSLAAHSSTKGWNASFNWLQQNQNYSLQLFGPLGAGHVSLTGTANQVILQMANGKSYTAANPNLLLQQQTGWQLPISNLYYWIRGLPVAGDYRYKRSLDMNNHIVHLRQQGWNIIYLRYVEVNGIDLPSRILLSNADWQVQVVIYRWQLN